MDASLSFLEITTRLLLAAGIGYIIGSDREKFSSAGVRTHMILAIGVCVITLLQVELMEYIITWNKENPDYTGVFNTDFTRLTAQIVSGIGFLGSGLILSRKDHSVSGLTTAVSLWTLAGISLAVGYGHYFIAILSTVFVMITLAVIDHNSRRRGHKRLIVHMEGQKLRRKDMDEFLEAYHGETTNYRVKEVRMNSHTEYQYHFDFTYLGFIDQIEFIEDLLDRYDSIVYIELI